MQAIKYGHVHAAQASRFVRLSLELHLPGHPSRPPVSGLHRLRGLNEVREIARWQLEEE